MSAERILSPEDMKRACRKKSKHGIKAVISMSVLASLIAGAEKWLAVQKMACGAESVDRTKLKANIDLAVQLYKKYQIRNANKAHLRNQEDEEREAEVEAAEGCQDELHGEEPLDLKIGGDGFEQGRRSVWDVLTGANHEPTIRPKRETDKGGNRPTKW